MGPEIRLETRKTPQQERAQATVDAILEAAAQVLVAEGVAKATTNRIAKKAGVSIGSLYQYFPNKESILVAVGQRLADRQMERLADSLGEITDLDEDQSVRLVITALIEGKRIEPVLSRMVFQEVHRLNLGDPVQDWLEQCEALVRMTLQTRPEILVDRDPSLLAFVVTHAVHGLILGVLFHHPAYLEDPRFIDETTELVLNYLNRGEPPG